MQSSNHYYIVFLDNGLLFILTANYYYIHVRANRFLDELGKTRFPAGGGYWMVTKKLDMSSWCKVSRPRTASGCIGCMKRKDSNEN